MTAAAWILLATLGAGDKRLDQAVHLYEDFQPEKAAPLLQTVATDTKAPEAVRARASLYLGLSQSVLGDPAAEASFREAFRLSPDIALPAGTPEEAAAAAEKVRAQLQAGQKKKLEDAAAALEHVEFPKVEGRVFCRQGLDAAQERVFISPVIAKGTLTEEAAVARLKAAVGDVPMTTAIIGGHDGFAVAVALGAEPGRVEPFRARCKALVDRPPEPVPVAAEPTPPEPTPAPAVPNGIPPPDPAFLAARVSPQGVLELATQPKWEELPADEQQRAVERAWSNWSQQNGFTDGLVLVHSRDAQTLYRERGRESTELESWGPKPSLPPATRSFFMSGGGSTAIPTDGSSFGFTANFSLGTYLFNHSWDISLTTTLGMFLQNSALGISLNVVGGVRRHWLLLEKIDLNVGAQSGYGLSVLGTGGSGLTIGGVVGGGYVLSMDPFQTIDLYVQTGLLAGSFAVVSGVGFTNTF